MPGVHAAVVPATPPSTTTHGAAITVHICTSKLFEGLCHDPPLRPATLSRAVLTSSGRDGRLMSWTAGPRRVLLSRLSGDRAEPTGGMCSTPPNWSGTTSVGSATRSTGPVGVFRLKSFHLGVLWVLLTGATYWIRYEAFPRGIRIGNSSFGLTHL